MACPLNAILNPVDPPAPTNPAPTTDDDEATTISDASTEIFDKRISAEETPDEEMLGFNTPTKNHLSPSGTDPDTGRWK